MLCDRCQAEVDRDGRPTQAASFMLRLIEDGRSLPPIKRKILAVLWDRRDRVVERDVLMNLLYSDYRDPPYESVLNVHISRLRRALAGTSVRIETIYGTGWRLVGE